ncbi:allantoinase AllB [soil metagenome]
MTSIVRSRRVLAAGTIAPASVHVDGGRITKVAAWDDVPAGASVDDHGERLVMAGIVDAHVHMNEPGRTEWEGFATATRSAAAGGVTTVVDMPLNSIPATTSVAGIEAKLAALDGQCHVDVGLWGGAIPDNDGDLAAMVKRGVLGFKCFLVDSGVPEFPPLAEDGLARAMKALAECNVPLLVHAELPGPRDRALATLPPPNERNVRTYLRYLRSRPPEAEDEAIALLLRLLETTRARTHVVHLASASGMELVRRGKEAGLPITAETTPHYLRLEAEAIPDGATAFKCAPPIREHANREKLWAGLREGVIDSVVTDHSPCTPELKKMELGDFDAAWGGIASLQLGLSVVWTEARARGVSLVDLSRWMSEAPARLAGLENKGKIAVGRDADFVVWDPDASFVVTKERILHRHKITPYEGQSLFGTVAATYLRGTRIFDGSTVTERTGRWLRGASA